MVKSIFGANSREEGNEKHTEKKQQKKLEVRPDQVLSSFWIIWKVFFRIFYDFPSTDGASICEPESLRESEEDSKMWNSLPNELLACICSYFFASIIGKITKWRAGNIFSFPTHGCRDHLIVCAHVRRTGSGLLCNQISLFRMEHTYSCYRICLCYSQERRCAKSKSDFFSQKNCSHLDYEHLLGRNFPLPHVA